MTARRSGSRTAASFVVVLAARATREIAVKLPGREDPPRTYPEQTLGRLDAGEEAERRAAERHGRRNELEHGQVHPPILRGQVESARQPAGAHFEPMQQRIDRQPLDS